MSVHPSLPVSEKAEPKKEPLPSLEIHDFTEEFAELRTQIAKIKEIQVKNAEEISNIKSELDELEKQALELLIKRLQK